MTAAVDEATSNDKMMGKKTFPLSAYEVTKRVTNGTIEFTSSLSTTMHHNSHDLQFIKEENATCARHNLNGHE